MLQKPGVCIYHSGVELSNCGGTKFHKMLFHVDHGWMCKLGTPGGLTLTPGGGTPDLILLVWTWTWHLSILTPHRLNMRTMNTSHSPWGLGHYVQRDVWLHLLNQSNSQGNNFLQHMNSTLTEWDISNTPQPQCVFVSCVFLWAHICVYTVWVCVYVCSHACCRHCAAVARRSGCSSNMVNRKSLNWAAWSSGHSYFSNRTSKRPHGFRLEMWRSSPETGTERWDRWWGTWELSGCIIRTKTERVFE